jgi:GMP synthase (glutamine-hydrolysing)
MAGMADEARRYYGCSSIRRSPTPGRAAHLERFVREICGCAPSWNPGNIIADASPACASRVGGPGAARPVRRRGFLGGRGAAAPAIGDQLTCVFVDHGLLRHHEGDQVMATFAEHLGVRVIRVDAAGAVSRALAGVADPEAKRKIIGRLFIEVFDEEAHKLEGVEWLAQGTIYPDVIESAGSKTGKAHVIKSHHNVGGLPEHMKLKLVEPLRELFKDEVRRIGVELGLPAEMVYRHPFPGPGLGVRILGEVTRSTPTCCAGRCTSSSRSCARRPLRQGQPGLRGVPAGEVGRRDGRRRRYDWVIALRAVETIDFMTARWAHLPYEFLDLVSRRIINEVKPASRGWSTTSPASRRRRSSGSDGYRHRRSGPMAAMAAGVGNGPKRRRHPE